MPFSIFRLRTLRGANIVGLLIGMSLFSMFFFISLYLQNVLRYSPIKTGIAYLPLAVGIIISAGLASQLVTRIGFRPTLIAGMLLVAGGLLWFSQVPGSGGSFAADVLGPSLLAALGFGFAFVSVTIAAVTGTKPHEAGLASGLINTSQQIGGALGLAILATIANSRTQSLFHAGVHSSAVALTKGFDQAFLVGAGFAVAGAILAAVLISSRDSHEHSKAASIDEAADAAEPFPSPRAERLSRSGAHRRQTRSAGPPSRRGAQLRPAGAAPTPTSPRKPITSKGPELMILITGATGNVGSELIAALLPAQAGHIRVLTRNPGAVFPDGTQKVVADLADSDLAPVLDGVHAVFLLTDGLNIAAHDHRLVAAARLAGVERIVKLSVLAVGHGATDPITTMHRAGEEAIRDSGIGWTFLRPTAFMSNALNWAPMIAADQVVHAPFAAGRPRS